MRNLVTQGEAAQAAERQRTGARVDKMEAAEDKAAQESSRGSFDRGIARLREMRTKKPRQVR